jgi:hypothetical protein
MLTDEQVAAILDFTADLIGATRSASLQRLSRGCMTRNAVSAVAMTRSMTMNR